MALDSRLEEITNYLLSNCCKNRSIYLCDEDIEECFDSCDKNKTEDMERVKKYLKDEFEIKFTTWD
jgi:hypothetical protein